MITVLPTPLSQSYPGQDPTLAAHPLQAPKPLASARPAHAPRTHALAHLPACNQRERASGLDDAALLPPTHTHPLPARPHYRPRQTLDCHFEAATPPLSPSVSENLFLSALFLFPCFPTPDVPQFINSPAPLFPLRFPSNDRPPRSSRRPPTRPPPPQAPPPPHTHTAHTHPHTAGPRRRNLTDFRIPPNQIQTVVFPKGLNFFCIFVEFKKNLPSSIYPAGHLTRFTLLDFFPSTLPKARKHTPKRPPYPHPDKP